MHSQRPKKITRTLPSLRLAFGGGPQCESDPAISEEGRQGYNTLSNDETGVCSMISATWVTTSSDSRPLTSPFLPLI